jgi:glycosyltransferase involved in cell wall biosynthesis
MNISVVIPSYNRKALLLRTLAALRAQTLPALEVIVADNGSSDGSREAAAAAGARVVLEGERGPAAARNRGAEAAAGDIIAFLDDDSAPEADWLERMSVFFAEHPEAVGAGGPAVADWEAEPPWYIRSSRKLRSYLGVFELGDRARPLDSYYDFLIGANCAFRREVFAGGARFASVPVGRPGTSEDMEFSRRAAAAAPVWYLPELRVRHFIAARKYAPLYIAALVFDCGLKKPFIRRRLCPRGPADLWGVDGLLSAFSFAGYLCGSLLLLWPPLRRSRDRELAASAGSGPRTR